MSSSRQTVTRLLKLADIAIDGDRPHDIKVHHSGFYDRLLAQGALGLGESYMDGDWDCEALDKMMYRALRADLENKVRPRQMLLPVLRAKLSNRQRKSRAFEVGKRHYDIGNDLFERMLDKRMTYTCAYWKDAHDLAAAQEAKLELVCQKIGLRPGMRVLDIGCGWGSFAGYAAEHYDAQVVGVTVSQEQVELASERYRGLDVSFHLQDYREVEGIFDRIISLGMFEHVGVKNYRTYLEVVDRCLVDDGIFLLHTIGSNHSKITTDAWTDKYIFPNGMPPSAAQITRAYEGLFVLRDWHSFGGDYDRTLMAWHDNFERTWSELSGYDERFYRMWRYFLLTAAGGFRANRNQLWQIVLTKRAASADYESVR